MITFSQSQIFQMPFGKHRGKALDEIAQTDDGLLYLDWILGELGEGTTKENVSAYLGDPTIAADVKKLVKA